MKKSLQFLRIAVLPLLIVAAFTFCFLDKEDPIARFQGDRICISLARLMAKVQQQLPLPGQIDTLFGLSWLEGYVVDTANRDIILVGQCKPERCPYHFEDLLVNVQNIFGDSAQAPYCSLDPLPENMKKLEQVLHGHFEDFQAKIDSVRAALGGQQVVVGGVPRHSRHSKVMIYADYDMKKASQGLMKLPGVRSTMEISQDLSNASSSMSRFWFHIKEGTLGNSFPSFMYHDGIVLIDDCPVVVLSEKQKLDATGKLSDQPTVENPVAEVFSAELSRNFSQLALQNPLFCELENLFRLQALLGAMKVQRALQQSRIDLNPMLNLRFLPSGANDLPQELPGLVNAEIREEPDLDNPNMSTLSFQLVAGGVSQEMRIDQQNLSKNGILQRHAATVLQKRPSLDTLCWMVNFASLSQLK